MKTIYQILAVLIILISSFNSKSQCLKSISQHCFSGNAIDNSGNGNNGQVIGASLTTGRFAKANTAYSFNGSTDYISLSPTNYINKNEFTYAAWVYPTQNPSANQANMILSVGNSGKDQMFGIYNNASAGLVGWCISTYSSFGVYSNYSTGKLPVLNKWYHIAFTRTNQIGKLYLDGNLVGTVTYTNSVAGYASSPVAYIGSRYNKTQKWNGKIDELSVHSCAMSASEISTLYASKYCDKDTCDVTIYDTIPVFDTVKLTVYDTVKIQVMDTIYKTVYDTIKVYDTVYVSVDGHSDKGESEQLIVFPNPSQGVVNVKLNKTCYEISYQLHSLSGQLLREKSVGFAQDFELTLPDDSGMYLLTVYSSGKVVGKLKLLRD